MSKSAQERLVKILSEEYLGTSFLGWSKQVSTGSGNDDPGDGFWVSQDVIIGMWMKSFTSGKTRAVTEARLLKKVKDNLRQAKGSLRAWSGPPSTGIGRPFRIVNEEIDHIVPFNEKIAVVVLNFIDCENPRCFKHDPAEIHLSVCLAATITTTLFKEFVATGASMLDLCIVIKNANWGEDGVTEIEAAIEFRKYLDDSFEKGGGKALFASWVDPIFRKECRHFRIARGGRESGTATKDPIINEKYHLIAGQMHDLTFKHVTALTLEVRRAKTHIKMNPSHMLIRGYKCGFNFVFLHVATMVDPKTPENKHNMDHLLKTVGNNLCFHFEYLPPIRDFIVMIQDSARKEQSGLNSFLLGLRHR